MTKKIEEGIGLWILNIVCKGKIYIYFKNLFLDYFITTSVIAL